MEDLKKYSVWVHKKSNKQYMLICITNIGATNPEFISQVVYEDDGGNVWSRPLSEWREKFIRLS
jgi:hypothetical protein